jgi:hypothetical protein
VVDDLTNTTGGLVGGLLGQVTPRTAPDHGR